MISLTTGTAFIMWLGEQITERGIGNGISLIIFAGIVCDMPDAVVPAALRRPRAATSPRSTWPVIGLIVVVVVAGHHLLRTRAATNPGPVRQTGGRPEDVRRAVDPPAAEGEHRRRHPADLRLVDPDVPAADRFVRAASLVAGRSRMRFTPATGSTTSSTSRSSSSSATSTRRSPSTRSTSPTT